MREHERDMRVGRVNALVVFWGETQPELDGGYWIVKVYRGLSALSSQNARSGKQGPWLFTIVGSDTLTSDELSQKLRNHHDVLSFELIGPDKQVQVIQDMPDMQALVGQDTQAVLSDIFAQGIQAAVNKLDHATELAKLAKQMDLFKQDKRPGLWGIKDIRAHELWDKLDQTAKPGKPVHVAVVDSGIDYTHPDIKPNFDAELSRNFWPPAICRDGTAPDEQDFMDYNGHGTHIAGTIASTGSYSGVLGISRHSKLIALRVSARDEDRTLATEMYYGVLCALDYLAALFVSAPNLEIAAVNLSSGFYWGYSPDVICPSGDIDHAHPFYLAFKTIDDSDRTLMVVAAGNDGLDIGVAATCDRPEAGIRVGCYVYPARFPNLRNFIVVGAADSCRMRAGVPGWSSNYSTEYVHLAAPGLSVTSTTSSHATGPMVSRSPIGVPPRCMAGGTSMAAPYVSGSIALLKTLVPSATTQQIKDALLKGAKKLKMNECPDIPRRHFTRHGSLDVKCAYDLLTGVSKNESI